MPVTKTAKRALRSSNRKAEINKKTITQLGVALRMAKRDRTKKSIVSAVKLTDRAAKKNVIHKNKAARIKSRLELLLTNPKETKSAKKVSAKKKK